MINSKHISGQFDIELDAVRDSVLTLGGLTKDQFYFATEGLNSGNIKLMRQVVDRGNQAKLLKVEIERRCTLILTKHQPEAADLRLVLTALKITTDLERIGDQAKLIVRKAEILIQRGTINQSYRLPVNIMRCTGLALSMVKSSMDAFSRSDTNIAAQVIRHDKLVNEEYNSIAHSLIDHMLKGPRSISMVLDILFVAKAIERIGDHAKSISQYVIFITTVCDVHHCSIEEMEKKVLQSRLADSGQSVREKLTESKEMAEAD